MATYALIPGGGGDPWEWHRLVAELTSRGQDAIAIRLPAEDDKAGWSEYADAVVDAIGDRADVTLVATSMGGFTAPIVCTIYDYADVNVPMLARMFDRRCRGYEAVGYTIVLPASAIPGWPADVILPSDPIWKRDYAASVRRLVRDGVDTPLARLFAHVARPAPADVEGVDRARSATEAFLYRRLATLAETKDRFRLNTVLPIAFDGSGSLEVDLLCADARVAVELDGAQHLGDPVAYRRDRRKDQLLQESGYLVLRFLAEDVGRELDMVLDAILRSLGRRSVSAGSAVPASNLQTATNYSTQ